MVSETPRHSLAAQFGLTKVVRTRLARFWEKRVAGPVRVFYLRFVGKETVWKKIRKVTLRKLINLKNAVLRHDGRLWKSFILFVTLVLVSIALYVNVPWAVMKLRYEKKRTNLLKRIFRHAERLIDGPGGEVDMPFTGWVYPFYTRRENRYNPRYPFEGLLDAPDFPFAGLMYPFFVSETRLGTLMFSFLSSATPGSLVVTVETEGDKGQVACLAARLGMRVVSFRLPSLKLETKEGGETEMECGERVVRRQVVVKPEGGRGREDVQNPPPPLLAGAGRILEVDEEVLPWGREERLFVRAQGGVGGHNDALMAKRRIPKPLPRSHWTCASAREASQAGNQPPNSTQRTLHRVTRYGHHLYGIEHAPLVVKTGGDMTEYRFEESRDLCLEMEPEAERRPKKEDESGPSSSLSSSCILFGSLENCLIALASMRSSSHHPSSKQDKDRRGDSKGWVEMVGQPLDVLLEKILFGFVQSEKEEEEEEEDSDEDKTSSSSSVEQEFIKHGDDSKTSPPQLEPEPVPPFEFLWLGDLGPLLPEALAGLEKTLGIWKKKEEVNKGKKKKKIKKPNRPHVMPRPLLISFLLDPQAFGLAPRDVFYSLSFHMRRFECHFVPPPSLQMREAMWRGEEAYRGGGPGRMWPSLPRFLNRMILEERGGKIPLMCYQTGH